MKKYSVFTLLLLLLSLSAFKCEENSQAEIVLETDCFDSSKVNDEATCVMVYSPVCGCDKKTYSNSCEATKNGILKYTDGECE